MSANRKLDPAQETLPTVDYAAPSDAATKHDLKPVVLTAEPAKRDDPLAAIKSLSEVELIALFS